MRRSDVINILNANRAAIEAFGVAALFLYGSYARDEAGPGSDVDVFVEADPSKRFGFLEYTNLIHFLEDHFGINVEIGTRASLHPRLKHDIEQSAVRVF
jgi:uncharacterized protein